RVPHLPARRRLDGARSHPPDPVPRRLLPPDACAVGGHRTRTALAVPGGELPSLPARLGAVPPRRRDAAPVMFPAAGDSLLLSPRVELHRLLALHLHLLAGLHAVGLLLPGGVRAAALRDDEGAGRRDAVRVPDDLVPAR